MPNANYRSGYNFELRVKKEWEGRGYFVVRSAGSHGKADLVAIKNMALTGEENKNKWWGGPAVFLIQCKTSNKISETEKEELRNLASDLSVTAVVVWRDDRMKLQEEILV